MKIAKISALVPIKSISERLHRKNFKFFGGQPLYFMILDKLQTIESIDKIIINTDSEEVSRKCIERFPKVIIINRPDFLKGNHITMNTLIDYDLTQVDGEHFLQTHVTNPLLQKCTINNVIDYYFNNLHQSDSLFTVNAIKKRVYYHNLEPINHNNSILEMTQNLPEILIENSNMFLFSRSSFINNNKSRIGMKPTGY